MALLTLSDARRLSAANRPWCFRMEYTGFNGSNQSGASAKFWLATGRGRNEPTEVRYGAIGTAGTVLIKDWAYVETKAPGKEAKGYSYADTPFLRVRQSTLDSFRRTGGKPTPATKLNLPKPGRAPAPAPKAPPAPTVVGTTGPAPTQWRCDTGKVTVTHQGSTVNLTFDKFCQPWCNETQSGAFKTRLEQQFRKRVWWGGNSSEVFRIHDMGGVTGFLLAVSWLQSIIPGLTTPLNGAPALTGPFAKIATVKPTNGGKWVALRADGRKLMDLTGKGARDLVRDYPTITVAGV